MPPSATNRRRSTLQVRLCEIPAPPYQEEVRGTELKRLFEELGLKRRAHR